MAKLKAKTVKKKKSGLPEGIERALEALLYASFSPVQQDAIKGIVNAVCDECGLTAK